jgi:hypothetical protein
VPHHGQVDLHGRGFATLDDQRLKVSRGCARVPPCGALGEDDGGVELASDGDCLLGERDSHHDASSKEWREGESRLAGRLET